MVLDICSSFTTISSRWKFIMISSANVTIFVKKRFDLIAARCAAILAFLIQIILSYQRFWRMKRKD